MLDKNHFSFFSLSLILCEPLRSFADLPYHGIATGNELWSVQSTVQSIWLASLYDCGRDLLPMIQNIDFCLCVCVDVSVSAMLSLDNMTLIANKYPALILSIESNYITITIEPE